MLSPGVQITEKDTTFNVTSVNSNAMAMVGLFRWGPVNQVVRITTNESELVQKFGTPDAKTTQFFHSALNYMTYVTPLYLVRATDDTALNAVPVDSTPVLIENDQAYEDAVVDGISFVARYPGELGNSLKVSVADSTGFTDWQYSGSFQYAPQEGEFNVVVIDEDGALSGTAGTILDKYEVVTMIEGSKKTDGTSAYFPEVLKNQSNYILVGDMAAIDFTNEESLGVYEVSLQGGVDGNDITTADFVSAMEPLKSNEEADIIGAFASLIPSDSASTLIDIMDSRQDAVAYLAPPLSAVYNNINRTDSIKEYFTQTINKNTSYAFYCDNWKMVYDKYSDKNIWIPCDSDVAALVSRVFVQNEAWFSPAGLNRGQLKNVIKLAWNSSKAQRDVLYKNAINSIVSMTGEGTVLWGDKTAYQRPSVFSRINVRNLFIVLKKSIARSARYQLFELNDDITRSIFRNAVNRYLAQVEGRRGLERFEVKCDENNNPPQVRNANEFVGDIYLVPTKSINFIKLNFIAVDSGVSFEEVEGV